MPELSAKQSEDGRARYQSGLQTPPPPSPLSSVSPPSPGVKGGWEENHSVRTPVTHQKRTDIPGTHIYKKDVVERGEPAPTVTTLLNQLDDYEDVSTEAIVRAMESPFVHLHPRSVQIPPRTHSSSNSPFRDANGTASVRIMRREGMSNRQTSFPVKDKDSPPSMKAEDSAGPGTMTPVLHDTAQSSGPVDDDNIKSPGPVEYNTRSLGAVIPLHSDTQSPGPVEYDMQSLGAAAPLHGDVRNPGTDARNPGTDARNPRTDARNPGTDRQSPRTDTPHSVGATVTPTHGVTQSPQASPEKDHSDHSSPSGSEDRTEKKAFSFYSSIDTTTDPDPSHSGESQSVPDEVIASSYSDDFESESNSSST